eukprot:3251097-Rhodomonas_salina.6
MDTELAHLDVGLRRLNMGPACMTGQGTSMTGRETSMTGRGTSTVGRGTSIRRFHSQASSPPPPSTFSRLSQPMPYLHLSSLLAPPSSFLSPSLL